MIYGNKRDYPKIDLFYNGKYVGSTTWAKTLKQAKEHYYRANWQASPVFQRITARFDR